MMMSIRNAFAAAAFAASACLVHAAGVSDKEIVLGTIQDLSGPVAMLGEHFRNGMQMRFDEVNASGGVHGRRIRLVVEDSGWDTKRGVLAASKLIDRDRVFALVNVLGSSIAVATIPSALERKVLSLFPAAPVSITYEPLSPYKFSLDTPYEQQVPIGVRYLVSTAGHRKVGAVYQDDDFGRDVLKGLNAVVGELGLQPCEQVSFRRGATDFSSQVVRLKQAGCDLVVIGGSTRETIGIMSEARKLDWKPGFYVTASAYSDQLHRLGGAAVEGLYATVSFPHPYEEGASPALAAWINAYKSRFNAAPSPFSVSGYIKADLFLSAAERAGPMLTAESMSKALESLEYSGGERFDVQAIRFSPDDHLGMRALRIAQVRDGRWRLLTDALR